MNIKFVIMLNIADNLIVINKLCTGFIKKGDFFVQLLINKSFI